MKVIKAVSFGGGVNSTALLIGMVSRQQRPDFILFADTGNEFKETYAHVAMFSQWLEARGFPRISVVHRGFWRHATLEQECHNLRTLPSKAFGYAGCSVKWKRQPMDRFLRKYMRAEGLWQKRGKDRTNGIQVERVIGIDWGEQHRGQIPDDSEWRYSFPLIEWKWDREACEEVILSHGMDLPRKSACTFCPSSTKEEVLWLAANRPELFERAVAIERQALNLQTVKGLGRHWSWEELVAAGPATQASMREADPIPCLCFDGERE